LALEFSFVVMQETKKKEREKERTPVPHDPGDAPFLKERDEKGTIGLARRLRGDGPTFYTYTCSP
jgi:hypothetical protein